MMKNLCLECKDNGIVFNLVHLNLIFFQLLHKKKPQLHKVQILNGFGVHYDAKFRSYLTLINNYGI